MKRRLTVSSYVTNFAEEEYNRSIFFFCQKGVFRGRGLNLREPPWYKTLFSTQP